MTIQHNRPPSGIRRRLVPPLVGVTVLAVLLGGASLLRGESQDAPAGGRGAPPAVLRLAGYQQPTAAIAADDSFRLAASLPAGPANAAIHWLTPPDTAQVERLAKALGMRGRLTTASGASTYSTGTASLRVQDGAGGQWQFLRAAFPDGIVACPAGPGPVRKGDGTASTLRCGVVPVPPDQPVPVEGDSTSTAVAPRSGAASKMLAFTTPAEARDAARPVLEATGIDPESAVVQAGQPQGFVIADPTVAGLATHGLTTTVSVSGKRVNSAGGWLGGWRAGATYPVISAHAAWLRLVHTPMMRPMMACAERSAASSDSTTCGGPLTVTQARFGLSVQEEDGRPLLVPSWLFDMRGSDNAFSVVAVDPRYLATPPVATPGGLKPGSTGSGSTGSGSTGSTGTLVPPVAPSSAPVTMPPTDSRFSSVTASGDGLVVHFTGGVSACYAYTVVPAESPQTVSLSLVERTTSNKPCIELAQVYERRVALAEPLGTRAVVDGHTGAVLLAASH